MEEIFNNWIGEESDVATPYQILVLLDCAFVMSSPGSFQTEEQIDCVDARDHVSQVILSGFILAY
jgi:hypothetical protein